jgi:hypothetical protein
VGCHRDPAPGSDVGVPRPAGERRGAADPRLPWPFPSKSFDGRGNYTLGVKEQIIFPEIDYDRVNKVHGMDITVVTSTNRDDEAFALLRELGFPFRGISSRW